MLISIIRYVALMGYRTENNGMLAMLGVWRVTLLSILFSGVGFVCSPAFIYLDIVPQSRSFLLSLFFYPMMGLMTVMFFASVVGMLSAMMEMLVSLGKLGQVKE